MDTARVLRSLWIGIVVLLLCSASVRAAEVFTIEVRGPIFAPVLEYLKIALAQAKAAEAEALLLELDTPGGSLDATKGIVQEILGAPVPVIVYVSPSGAGAMSAGTFLTLAGHVAAMAPGTTIGAAHPVMIFGGGGDAKEEDVMGKKIENYAVSFIEAIAEQRGRNVAWAAEAVRDSSSITAEVALEKKVIDLVAADRAELLQKIDGRAVKVGGVERKLATAGATLREIDMTLDQSFYFFLSQPTVIFLLLLVGLGGLYLEFTQPGMIGPGVIGAISLLLALIGFSIVPINYTGAALFALGLVLIVAEVFVPSFGALGIGGFACLIAGSLLLFHTVEAPGLVINRALLAATATAFGAAFLAIGTLVVRSQTRPVATGEEGMIGQVGVVRRRLEPRGTVAVAGELWEARLTTGEALEPPAEVIVVGVEGLRLVVEPHRRTS